MQRKKPGTENQGDPAILISALMGLRYDRLI